MFFFQHKKKPDVASYRPSGRGNRAMVPTFKTTPNKKWPRVHWWSNGSCTCCTSAASLVWVFEAGSLWPVLSLYNKYKDLQSPLPFSQARWASRAIVWMVLPRPISSAKMPLSFFSYIVTNQSSPMCWYSRSVPWSRNGMGVFTFVDGKNQNVMV